MRRVVLAAALACALSGCRPAPVAVQEDEQILGAFGFADPRAPRQLLAGFHDVEDSAWRWTAGRFSLMLAAPAEAYRLGAKLELRLTVPEPVIARRGAVTLSPSVEGVPLPSLEFEQPGAYVYSAAVPAAALAFSPVVVTFTLDRFLKAGEVDGRELGVVVNSIALR